MAFGKTISLLLSSPSCTSSIEGVLWYKWCYFIWLDACHVNLSFFHLTCCILWSCGCYFELWYKCCYFMWLDVFSVKWLVIRLTCCILWSWDAISYIRWMLFRTMIKLVVFHLICCILCRIVVISFDMFHFLSMWMRFRALIKVVLFHLAS